MEHTENILYHWNLAFDVKVGREQFAQESSVRAEVLRLADYYLYRYFAVGVELSAGGGYERDSGVQFERRMAKSESERNVTPHLSRDVKVGHLIKFCYL